MADAQRNLVTRRNVLVMLASTGVAGLNREPGRQRAESASPAPALKTIGVIGGIGPQATMDFEARVHRVAQRLIPPHENSGYPPMVVYYHRRPPIVMNEDRSARIPITPDPRLLEGAKWLGSIADFLVIASNGPHMIQDQIEGAAGRKVLSMIDVTLSEVQRRGWRKVGVLGFGDPMVYTHQLGKLNIPYTTIDAVLRANLDTEVMKVMEGRDTADSSAVARHAVDYLRAGKVDGIILGCTEIPLLLRGDAQAPDLIDPAQLLAEAAVAAAMA